MATANFERVKKRVIQILGANASGYSDTVDGEMDAFAYDQEIIDAALEADARLITEGYFYNPTLASAFETVSGELDSGATIPQFYGLMQAVELKDDGVWTDGIPAQSKADVIQLNRYGAAYLGAENIAGWFFVEGTTIFHTSEKARVTYPSYTKTADLQALEMHETAIIAGTLSILYKPGSPFHSEANWQHYSALFEQQVARIAAQETGGNE